MVECVREPRVLPLPSAVADTVADTGGVEDTDGVSVPVGEADRVAAPLPVRNTRGVGVALALPPSSPTPL